MQPIVADLISRPPKRIIAGTSRFNNGFDIAKNVCQVICGGLEVCQNLLALRFDHIFYTGGTVGARAIYTAAANFLTPVTLELGGKCPSYVDAESDLHLAARRIAWGKIYNAGQACVGVDYVLLHSAVASEFYKHLEDSLLTFLGKDPQKSPDFARIVNEKHFERLVSLLRETKGKVLVGGTTDEEDLYISPTVVVDVQPNDSLMSEELVSHPQLYRAIMICTSSSSSSVHHIFPICPSPDPHQSEFYKHLEDSLLTFLGKDPQKSPDFARIVNKKHFERLISLLRETKGKIIVGGMTDEEDLYISPTVVVDVQPNDSLMSEELFGPILPIMKVDSPEEAVNYIRSKEKPLACYVFTRNADVFSLFKQNTSSGSLTQNGCCTHFLASELPFGGVGASGIGRYHGKFSLDTFSHLRGVLIKSTNELVNQRTIYPPYTEGKIAWTEWLLSGSDRRFCSIL
ncbi:unnamed protein product [Dicrocoelium dendriticum]|nr:unnamed protein product [Dicrocoelium dendriticum]